MQQSDFLCWRVGFVVLLGWVWAAAPQDSACLVGPTDQLAAWRRCRPANCRHSVPLGGQKSNRGVCTSSTVVSCSLGDSPFADHSAWMGDACYEEILYPDGCTDVVGQCGLRVLQLVQARGRPLRATACGRPAHQPWPRMTLVPRPGPEAYAAPAVTVAVWLVHWRNTPARSGRTMGLSRFVLTTRGDVFGASGATPHGKRPTA